MRTYKTLINPSFFLFKPRNKFIRLWLLIQLSFCDIRWSFAKSLISASNKLYSCLFKLLQHGLPEYAEYSTSNKCITLLRDADNTYKYSSILRLFISLIRCLSELSNLFTYFSKISGLSKVNKLLSLSGSAKIYFFIIHNHNF